MRTIADHKLNGLNDALEITVLDEPGAGGACHEYGVIWNQKPSPNAATVTGNELRIRFQNGPIAEAGVNGISGEALLAIVIDRLRCFQAGPYASGDNADALSHLELALQSLQKRTRERMARGVEGTSAK